MHSPEHALLRPYEDLALELPARPSPCSPPATPISADLDQGQTLAEMPAGQSNALAVEPLPLKQTIQL